MRRSELLSLMPWSKIVSVFISLTKSKMPNEFLIRRTHEYRRPVPPPIVPIFTEEEIAAWDEEMRISRERFDENMARRSDPWPTYNWDDTGVGGFDLNSFISGASRGNVTYEDIHRLFMRYRGK